ncbi:EamA family transporter, partial [Rhizobium ruizarguesonis]
HVQAQNLGRSYWYTLYEIRVALVTRSYGFNIEAPALLGLAYVSLFSMLIGFIFWYRGLSQGGIAAVGQLQLLQPFFGLALAATLLHEPVT